MTLEDELFLETWRPRIRMFWFVVSLAAIGYLSIELIQARHELRKMQEGYVVSP